MVKKDTSYACHGNSRGRGRVVRDRICLTAASIRMPKSRVTPAPVTERFPVANRATTQDEPDLLTSDSDSGPGSVAVKRATTKNATKKAPVKKAAAKKSTAKKAPAKKAPKKAAAKKTTTRKATGKRAATKKAATNAAGVDSEVIDLDAIDDAAVVVADVAVVVARHR